MQKISGRWRHRRSTRFVSSAALLIGACPLIMAALCTRSVPEAAPMSGRPLPKQLVFSQYAVNLGEVRPTGTIPAHFEFLNLGDSPIEIVRFDPSCGCLAPKLYDGKTVYEPRERGRFYVSVNTAKETPGPKAYTVGVHYTQNGQSKQETVTFRMSVPERKVSVVPPEVYFYQLNGEPDSREIVVEDHRGQDLNVLEVVCSSELAEVTVGQKVYREGVPKTPIRIDVPGDPPAGRNIAFLEIRTDDPEFPTIPVPILIHGPLETVQQVSGEMEIPINQTPPNSKRDSPSAD